MTAVTRPPRIGMKIIHRRPRLACPSCGRKNLTTQRDPYADRLVTLCRSCGWVRAILAGETDR